MEIATVVTDLKIDGLIGIDFMMAQECMVDIVYCKWGNAICHRFLKVPMVAT